MASQLEDLLARMKLNALEDKATREDPGNAVGLRAWVAPDYGRIVYKDVPADGLPPKLHQAHIDRSADVIDEELYRAGVRLAMFLNRAGAM